MPVPIRRRVLFISNGHGEDLSGAAVAVALRGLAPEVELSALPIVGAGNSYRREGIFCHCEQPAMPSGGFVYMSAFQLWRDLQAGLVGQIWQQWQAARQFGTVPQNADPNHNGICHDLVFATGDVVALGMARATGRDYFSYLVPFSAYYENRLRLPFPTVQVLRHRRCLQVFARDQFTARLLQQQRVHQAQFVGNAFMDVLASEPAISADHHSLGLKFLATETRPIVALLPGSRLPECGQNLRLMLDFCTLWHDAPPVPAPASHLAWYAAITPSLLAQIPALLVDTPWQWQLLGQDISQGVYLERTDGARQLRVYCVADVFSEILHRCAAVVGMAGTALEQAVGLGKPVITFVGEGPQFTYRFAEAQYRLLGSSIHFIAQGKHKADQNTLRMALPILAECLYNPTLQQQCEANGRERIGGMGGAVAMAQAVLAQFAMMSKAI